MRFLLSILVIAILLSGYQTACDAMCTEAAQKTNIETASLSPCPDHHAHDKHDGKTPGFEGNCQHCSAFPIGTTAAIEKAVYARKAVPAPAHQAFLVNRLTFPLFRPPQSLA